MDPAMTLHASIGATICDHPSEIRSDILEASRQIRCELRGSRYQASSSPANPETFTHEPRQTNIKIRVHMTDSSLRNGRQARSRGTDIRIQIQIQGINQYSSCHVRPRSTQCPEVITYDPSNTQAITASTEDMYRRQRACHPNCGLRRLGSPKP
jgi:hypothetical protein